MKRWKTAALAVALAGAAGVGAAIAPAARAQTTVYAGQSPNVVEIFRGSGSRIGVSVTDGDADSAKAGAPGARVEDVTAGGPAEKAGIRKGDVIVEFDGERVRSARQLTRLVQETPPGREVPVAVLRDGERTTLTVRTEEGGRFSFERFGDLEALRDLPMRIAPRPPAPPKAPSPPEPPSVFEFDSLLGRTGRLGITVHTLTPQLAEYFGAKEGVLVASVTEGSAADKAGVKAGDVITSINGRGVDDASELARETRRLEDNAEFTLEIVRDKKTMTLKGKVERVERPSRRTIL